ncbi:terminase small subunit [Deinococcus yavapaiensis]|uniref:Phage terminase small subunit n=1 Tax=Deinococcus yavapaiensis KR-236 TaxID=694435 RepID=A0A318S3V6_9DEIO|nr:terminase small subunit [Deinococcus yavapaiensis]PYE51049.1 phage terminase small subunit [Deinococcus yavapaiensis KR-236]
MTRTAQKATSKGRATPRSKLTAQDREEKFALAYHAKPDATRAAITAGYKETSASSQGSRLLKKRKVQDRLRELATQAEQAGVATAHERQRFWTSVMRGEVLDHDLFFGEVKPRPASLKDRLKAAELLGKAHGDFIDRIEHSGELDVISIEILPPIGHDGE